MPRPASDGQISRETGNVPPGLTGGVRPETIWTDHRRWIRGIECSELCHGHSGLFRQPRSVSRPCINILILLFVDMGWGKHARVEWVGCAVLIGAAVASPSWLVLAVVCYHVPHAVAARLLAITAYLSASALDAGPIYLYLLVRPHFSSLLWC